MSYLAFGGDAYAKNTLVRQGSSSQNSKGGLSAALLSFDLLDQIERGCPFGGVGIRSVFVPWPRRGIERLCGCPDEVLDVVKAGQCATRCRCGLAPFDLSIQARVQSGVDGQRAPQPEHGAVHEALYAPATPLPVAQISVRPVPSSPVRLPMPEGVIADERRRQDGADVADGLVGRHPRRYRLAPAHEVIELVAETTPHDILRLRHVAPQIGGRFLRVLVTDIDPHAATMLSIGHCLREARRVAIRRGQNAPDHVLEFLSLISFLIHSF